MKSMNDIQKTLMKFKNKYGIDLADGTQRTEDWFLSKMGVVSASNISKAVSKGEMRNTYMCELISQIATGITEDFDNKYTDWGNQHEPAAHAAYEFSTGDELTHVSFVFKDDNFREGCSPDGLNFAKNKGAEIKCPYNTVHYVKFLLENKVKKEYDWQAQYQMRVLDADIWDFSQYDPRMKKKPIKIVPFERDEKMQKTLDDAIPQFLKDMDDKLAEIGLVFGDQWLRDRTIQQLA